MLRRPTQVLLLLLLSVASLAHADDTDPDRDARAAKQLYRQAVEAYAQERYEDAIALFQRADELVPSPAHSYNVARAYEALGKETEAVKWYRDYLKRSEHAPDAAAIEQRVAHLEADARRAHAAASPPVMAIGAGEAPAAPPPAPEPPSAPAPATKPSAPSEAAKAPDVAPVNAAQAPDTANAPDEPEIAPPVEQAASPTRSSGSEVQRTVGVAAMVGGGAALAGSLVFELLRRDAESDANNSTVQIDYADKVDTMESRQLASRVLLGAGAGLALLGSLLFFTAPDTAPNDDTRVSVSCNGHGCGVSAFGRY